MQIAPAVTADLAAIQGALRDAHLPYADITTDHLADFLVAKKGEVLVGAVGLERYERDALLRSLVVSSQYRGSGIANELIANVESKARQAGLASLVLLTTTASAYFAKLGYKHIDRQQVPTLVQASAEFASICPASAVCMQKTVRRPRLAFICIENSNRSQMAQGFAGQYSNIDAVSAGSRPSGIVNPRAITMMAEKHISLADHESKSLDRLTGEFDAVVTMGCGDSCPWIPARRRIDWALPDPRHLDDAGFRRVRDEIEQRVRSLVTQLQAEQ